MPLIESLRSRTGTIILSRISLVNQNGNGALLPFFCLALFQLRRAAALAEQRSGAEGLPFSGLVAALANEPKLMAVNCSIMRSDYVFSDEDCF